MFGAMFSPAMFVGVTAGAIAGRLLAMLGLSVAGPGLAICGMAAVAASVIGAPSDLGRAHSQSYHLVV